MNTLKHKTAVVTGASSGIGFSIAKKMANEGFNIMATARRKERLDILENEGRVQTYPQDITTASSSKTLLDLSIEHFGGCDILINSAGLIEVGKIEDIDIDAVCEMVKVKIEANYRLTYTFLKHFKKQGYGHVINISSVMGSKIRETAGAYCGTNYAIEALSEALRMELAGTNVKISCIEPGLVMTELHDKWETHPKNLLNITDPLQPIDIAKQVLYILQQPEHVQIPKLMILPNEHKI
ncbi:MAG: SDR family oxidoreductase [Bacteroidales bacterium]|nr:SDR family oxidoreductase [Bacteroidales bacterium]